jgi:hypothetical protein
MQSYKNVWVGNVINQIDFKYNPKLIYLKEKLIIVYKFFVMHPHLGQSNRLGYRFFCIFARTGVFFWGFIHFSVRCKALKVKVY